MAVADMFKVNPKTKKYFSVNWYSHLNTGDV